ncbi:MAG: hypothetical protein KGJ60_09625 [Verrucomicrobiota bacterium]|nr:hypothetical protein [Verrucomicrobiota bacterium]
MNERHPHHGNRREFSRGPGLRTVLPVNAKLATFGLVLAALAASLRAQQVTVVGQPVRATVPVNDNGSTEISCAITVTTNGLNSVDANGNWVINPITLSATAPPAIPAGLSFAFTDTNGNALAEITPVISTNVAAVTTNVLLWVNTTNVAEGIYPFSLNTGGAATDTLWLTLQVAHIWSGQDSTNGVSADLADAGNWNGGNVPGPTGDVVITDAGSLGSSDTTTNILISGDMEIGSFRQAITSGNTSRDNIGINPGATLSVTGTNGFSAGLRDASDAYQKWELTFTGDEGTLVLSNQNADLDTFAIENQTPLLDLSSLGTFIADLRQMHFDDYRAYPNYDNMADNGYSGSALPRRLPVPEVHWARTNIVHLNFSGDPDNWTNPAFHQYSMIIGNNTGRGGSTQRHHTWFGISNLFEMNSICFAGSGVAMDQSSGAAAFNSAFTADNPIAVFRGPNGLSDRLAMFAIADNSGEDSSGSSTKAIVDFTGGTVDALVDRLYLARDRTNANGGYARAEMDMGAGTFDANQVILGYQGEGNNYGNNEDYCQGILVVDSNGVFRANDAIDLGYTTADATNNSSSTANASAGYGQITVNAGGTVVANVIRVGGVTKLSENNTITINGGNLVVSNTIAGADKYLTGLTVENGGALTLFLNGTNTTPYVYTTNLVTSGAATIAIAGVTNLTLPAQVPLIQYAAGTPTFGVSLPSGYSGAIINNGPGSTIDVYISAGAPKSLVWRGYVNSDWDTTTKNWLDLNTGLQTNFADLDNVSFDDGAGVPSTVNLAAANLIPTSVSMNNSSLNYTLGGSGTISGSATLTKSGAASLDIEANTTLTVALNQGLLTGAGIINSAVIASSAMMNYSGTVSAGVVCAGLVVNSGTINGLVDVQAGGVFTNLSTLDGPFTLESGSFLENDGTMNGVGPTATVNVNALLLNNGNISDSGVAGGGTVQMYGTLEDTGAGSITLLRLNILPGALFIPGGDGIGTTTVASDGVGTYPGRLSLNAGSTTILKADPGASSNTVVRPDHVDFGPSQKYQSQDGCTLLITNVSATPFAAGQVFNLFDNDFGGDQIFNTGASTNAFPIIEPPTPGPGLSWDLSQLWPNGYIGVVATPVAPLTNSFEVVSGAVVANLSWSPSQLGWVLETQQNPLSVGLSTNWVRINGTSTVTSMSITNVLGNNVVFYRLVYP